MVPKLANGEVFDARIEYFVFCTNAVIIFYIYRKNAVNMYIHKKNDWPKFTWDADVITSLLGTVRHRTKRG